MAAPKLVSCASDITWVQIRFRFSFHRAEYLPNRRLAPDVYLDVVPLTASTTRLAISGEKPVVDWLVVSANAAAVTRLNAAISEIVELPPCMGALQLSAPIGALSMAKRGN